MMVPIRCIAMLHFSMFTGDGFKKSSKQGSRPSVFQIECLSDAQLTKVLFHRFNPPRIKGMIFRKWQSNLSTNKLCFLLEICPPPMPTRKRRDNTGYRKEISEIREISREETHTDKERNCLKALGQTT